MQSPLVIPVGLLGIILLHLILSSFFTVSTAQVAVITRFGKFLRIAEAGLNWKRPFFDRVAGLVSLRVNQITLSSIAAAVKDVSDQIMESMLIAQKANG